MSKSVAEFVGTCSVVFTVGCNVLGGKAQWAGVSIARVLMVTIHGLASISGANITPVVSVALGLLQTPSSSSLGWMTADIFCCVQIVAGVAAAFPDFELFGKAFNLSSMKGMAGAVCAGVREFLHMFIGGGKNTVCGQAIGCTTVVGTYGARAFFSGCSSPVVAIGFWWCLAHLAFVLVGTALEAGFFCVARPRDFGGEHGIAAKLTSEFIGAYMLIVGVGPNSCASSPATALPIVNVGAGADKCAAQR